MTVTVIRPATACCSVLLASIAANLTRPSDLGARFGGDEFAALLPDTSLADAADLAMRIRDDLTVRCGAHETERGHARLSIGVACLVADEQARHYNLIAAADKALYQAKRRGRVRVELAETSSDELAFDAGATTAPALVPL
jgi:diguanylate cyclase (GGDEF)-like protein